MAKLFSATASLKIEKLQAPTFRLSTFLKKLPLSRTGVELSDANGRISRLLNKGGIAVLSLLRVLLAFRLRSPRPSVWKSHGDIKFHCQKNLSKRNWCILHTQQKSKQTKSIISIVVNFRISLVILWLNTNGLLTRLTQISFWIMTYKIKYESNWFLCNSSLY